MSTSSTVALRDEAGGVLVTVKVIPRASHPGLTYEAEALRARVTAPPVEGAANEAVIALLADRFRVPKRAITLRQGATSRLKVFQVAGLTAAEALARLGASLS